MPFWWKASNRKPAKKNTKPEQAKEKDTSGMAEEIPLDAVGSDLNKRIDELKKTTGNSSDIVIHEIEIGQEIKTPAAIICVDGLNETATVNKDLLEILMGNPEVDPCLDSVNVLETLQKQVIKISGVKRVSKWNDLFLDLFSGDTILMVDKVSGALSISTRGGEKRAVEEPATEVTVRGPRDGFTESLRVNTALIRRRIKNPNLWMETMQIGEVTQTDICMMYIKGIANDKVIEEVRNRLKRIKIDAILESGYIEQFIEDKTFSPFPTLYHTERPDVVSANLLEGRFVIIVDGSPFVLLAPALFIQFFQAAEDYYSRFDIATAIRFLRILVFMISLIGPASYVAATTFHQEMIPTQLVFTLTAQREAIPFPALVEAMIMEITFEILREAGLRLPRPIGQTVSIVGALVIGQAAVQAGLVSAAMVIVVSITAIASFATPAFAIAISARLIRFVFILLAATFGFYGLIIGMLFMVIHLCSLRSFGIPYMMPLAPTIKKNMGDSVFRAPLWLLKERPRLISQKNISRRGQNQMPMPEQGDTKGQGNGDSS